MQGGSLSRVNCNDTYNKYDAGFIRRGEKQMNRLLLYLNRCGRDHHGVGCFTCSSDHTPRLLYTGDTA